MKGASLFIEHVVMETKIMKILSMYKLFLSLCFLFCVGFSNIPISSAEESLNNTITLCWRATCAIQWASAAYYLHVKFQDSSDTYKNKQLKRIVFVNAVPVTCFVLLVCAKQFNYLES